MCFCCTLPATSKVSEGSQTRLLTVTDSNVMKLSTAQAWGPFEKRGGKPHHLPYPYPYPYPTLPYPATSDFRLNGTVGREARFKNIFSRERAVTMGVAARASKNRFKNESRVQGVGFRSHKSFAQLLFSVSEADVALGVCYFI